jgi:hypothetical protein
MGVSFGSFTGNGTLTQWFGLLNKFYGVTGEARVSFKLHGKDKTPGIDKQQGLENLMAGLQDEKTAYIYHCYNHYMCPIGFDNTPQKPWDAYKPSSEICEFTPWIIVGEISKCYPCFHTFKWDHIYEDIDCAFPRFMNIRKVALGV